MLYVLCFIAGGAFAVGVFMLGARHPVGRAVSEKRTKPPQLNAEVPQMTPRERLQFENMFRYNGTDSGQIDPDELSEVETNG